MTGRAGLDEAAARGVVLLQSFESVVDPPAAVWSAEDAAWTTRAAREAATPAAGDSAQAFLATRASLGLRRLLPRVPALAAAWPSRLGSGPWLGGAVLLGLGVGIAADAIGSSQRINLLAPPIWTVVAWNLVVYLLLIVAAARSAFSGLNDRRGAVVRLAERLLSQRPRRGRQADAPDAPDVGTAAALRGFALRWSVIAAPLVARRAGTLLHAAAAALGLGLVAGLYARGLVLDYRVAWESTFLSPADLHAALSTLLAPASALSGIGLPDVAAVAALRAAHGDAAIGASAAPWLHLYAVTLLLAVVLPRTVLAVASAWRARRAAANVRLPSDDPYFRRLDLQRRGDVARVALCPYAQTPTATAIAGARSLLADVLGDGLEIDVAPTTPFGGEDDTGVSTPAAGGAPSVVIALFDLTATPEPEHHGRFVTALAGAARAATVVVLVDETAFFRRFGAADARVAERRAAWSRLFAAQGTVPAFARLDAAVPAPAAVASVRTALGSPSR